MYNLVYRREYGPSPRPLWYIYLCCSMKCVSACVYVCECVSTGRFIHYSFVFMFVIVHHHSLFWTFFRSFIESTCFDFFLHTHTRRVCCVPTSRTCKFTRIDARLTLFTTKILVCSFFLYFASSKYKTNKNTFGNKFIPWSTGAH